MEIGITGGEEDGVDNTGMDQNKLYTQPEQVGLQFAVCTAVEMRRCLFIPSPRL